MMTLVCSAGPSGPSPMGGTPQRPGAAGGQLAPGWTEHTAPDGRKYYFNKAIGKSAWDKPLADAATPVPKARPSILDLQLYLISWPPAMDLPLQPAALQQLLPAACRCEGEPCSSSKASWLSGPPSSISSTSEHHIARSSHYVLDVVALTQPYWHSTLACSCTCQSEASRHFKELCMFAGGASQEDL